MTDTNKVEKLEQQITPVVSGAISFKINSAVDLVKATEKLSLINHYADTVEAEKEKLTKPLNLTLKNIRAMFRPLEERLESSVSYLRSAISKYQTSLVEEEKKISDRVKPGKGNLSLETAVAKLDKLGITSEVVTDSGSVQFREVKKFEVVDVSLLPKEYIVANETAIRIAMRNEVELPGVRYFTEQSVVNTR